VRRSPLAAFAGLFSVTLFSLMGVGAVLPVLPLYVRGPLDSGDFAVGIVIGAFAFTALGVRPLAGHLADIRGRRPVVVAGSTLAVVAGGLYFVPAGMPGLIASRLVLGAGEGMVFTAGATWVVDLAPPERRGRVLGLYGLAVWTGLSLGPPIGDALLRASSFDAVWAFACVSPAIGAMVALQVPDPFRPGERTERGPLIARESLGPGIALSLATVGYAAMASFIVLDVESHGSGHGAVAFTAFAATVVVTRLVLGGLPDRIGPLRCAAGAAGVETVGLALIALANGLPLALAGSIAMGAAFSLLYPSLSLLVVNRVPYHRRGAALGTFTAFFDLGVGLGGPLTGAAAALSGYSGAFWLASACGLASGAVIALRLSDRLRMGVAAAAVAGLTIVLVAGGGSGGTTAAQAPGGAPNLVVLMTDDQTTSDLARAMPLTEREIAGHGTTFGRYLVTTPLCCPSRASYITGQYGHNNGVLDNHPGYPDLRDPANVLPAWLGAAGYRTAHMGKWLNGYERDPGSDGGRLPAPGWDDWAAMLSPHYYDYELDVNGRIQRHGASAADYSTTVLTRRATGFVRRSAGARPFFLSVAYAAPHVDTAPARAAAGCQGDAIPAPRDAGAFGGAPLPASPSYDEADVRDKPAFIRRLPRLDAAQRAGIARAYDCNLASLRAVDRSVARIVGALRQSGELADTAIVFTSDNGYLYGEHRLPGGKALPYEESTRVPLIIRPPSGTASPPAHQDALAASIDLAPTLLDLAGVRPCTADDSCRTLDGRSLVPLLEGRRPGWSRRRGLLIQSAKQIKGVCDYRSLRTPRYSLSLYRVLHRGAPRPCGAKPVPELYDLRRDPYELRNLLGSPAHGRTLKLQARLTAELRRLGRCAGTGEAAGARACS
jgi:arylsulfatase A-like enzyme/MFS family permease